MSEQTACGCQRIHYQPEDLGDGSFRERWRCLYCKGEFVRAAELAVLEAKLSKMERQIELAQNAMVRAQPTAHELDGAIVVWEVAWDELREALAGGEEA